MSSPLILNNTKHRTFFVTGTDTNVGKTIASAYLSYHLQAAYFKPIQSGTPTDAAWIAEHGFSELIYPPIYQFAEALSPNQAAESAEQIIDIQYLETSILAQIQNHQNIKNNINNNKNLPLIIEGAGGLYVPLHQDYCMLDLIAFLSQSLKTLQVLIVTRAGLGTINHTVLTYQALRAKGIAAENIHILMMGENLKNQRDIQSLTSSNTSSNTNLDIQHIKTLPYFTNLNNEVNDVIELKLKQHQAPWLKFLKNI